MEYFVVNGLKVLIFLLSATQGIEPSSPTKPDLALVANILQNLFKTYTRSLRESRSFFVATDKPPQLESTVEKVINTKVKELKPFLQDYDNFHNVISENNRITDDKNKELIKDNEDNNLTLEGEEDTTIIEFHPDTDNKKQSIRVNDKKPREFKDNVRKYKIIRDKIKNALIEESVSFKTRKFITNTLDDMLATMVRSQCPTNSNLDGKLYDHVRFKAAGRTTKDLVKNWTEQWQAIKDKYNKIWKDHFPKRSNPARKLFMFFEQIQEFLTTIVTDTDNISNNYKVVCRLVKKEDTNDEIYFNNLNLVNFRTGEHKKKYNCPTFKICSDELRRFMGRFYNNLNDTAVSTFRNYAAMYKSDINSDDSGEKESVVAVINKLGNLTEQKISKIFKETTENFEMNHDKDKDENIRLLRSYIRNTIDSSLHTIKNNVNSEILYLRARLLDNLKQDLRANIDVDLGNVATEMKDSICRHFASCNGRIMRRSFDDFDYEMKSRAHKPIDKNKVYVKLQMNFDNELKEDIARGNVDILDNALLSINNVVREQLFSVSKVVNVTRTTQHDKFTVAKIAEKTSQEDNTEMNFKKENSVKNSYSEDIEKLLKKKKFFLENAGSDNNLKKVKLEKTLKKDNHERNSYSKDIQKLLEKNKFYFESSDSKNNSKKDKLEKTLKKDKLEKNSYADDIEKLLEKKTAYLATADSKNNLKNDKPVIGSEIKVKILKKDNLEKYSENEVTEKNVKPMRTSTAKEMGSTRLIPNEVSAEILE